MKILTLFGTRPEIIRLSQIIKRLDRFCEQVLVHTGQNYDPNLSEIFFRDLTLRTPDYYLGVRAEQFSERIGQILARSEAVIDQVKPDRILILGDTDSGLASIVAARRGIPVFHMEAGNRCYDDRVPEEINRRVIDHCSTILLPYTQRSKDNLIREGIARDRIFVIGNPIYEVINAYLEQIKVSDILTELGLQPQSYFLCTMHRAENVDDRNRLCGLWEGINLVADKHQLPIIVSLHPRTADKMRRFGLKTETEHIRLVQPLGFFDFVKLEQNALCVISDSGTVQEECCVFRVPAVTIRDVTERPETIECGSNVLTGAEPVLLLRTVDLVLSSGRTWNPPAEYLEPSVSTTVSNITLGYVHTPR